MCTIDTNAKTDYPKGLQKKGLNIKCLNMCFGFQKLRLPLSESYEVAQHFKKQSVVFLVVFDYRSILCFAFIPCGID